ncbi:MAG: 3-dehydroquinate dehydratase [Candidatus Aerophobetes bacterium ADurb.Bin490]|nr:MAG: 3-dehydroquinate dehydratase [Candidatus Aerophobetes bacterium ADurb.Bin490]HPI02846.1 type II 3-dehydroquinate dehydratase [Candidatus Goldiibacteriota bacterium]HPN63718.1 type II 3-dehydroquinate dehydratase [Candidatus Goldiibacteriota bacterium]HRQ43587.1 type II 3-dehydroquinate dehydratase [Candidatus Goldiibacteriota bacterium]
MKKILVIHGPNLNLLGQREPDVYGNVKLSDINDNLSRIAAETGIELKIVQSNHEGEIVDAIHQAINWAQCIIINPAAYTHTSVAIRDALASVSIPAIEVHLSNIYKREDFRQKSFVAQVVAGQISGFGAESYYLALEAASKLIQ